MTDYLKYQSELDEDELYRLWMLIKEKWPVAFDALTNPDYLDPDHDEKDRACDAVIHSVLDREHRVNPRFPKHYDMYHDMRVFLGFYLDKNAIRGRYFRDSVN